VLPPARADDGVAPGRHGFVKGPGADGGQAAEGLADDGLEVGEVSLAGLEAVGVARVFFFFFGDEGREVGVELGLELGVAGRVGDEEVEGQADGVGDCVGADEAV